MCLARGVLCASQLQHLESYRQRPIRTKPPLSGARLRASLAGQSSAYRRSLPSFAIVISPVIVNLTQPNGYNKEVPPSAVVIFKCACSVQKSCHLPHSTIRFLRGFKLDRSALINKWHSSAGHGTSLSRDKHTGPVAVLRYGVCVCACVSKGQKWFLPSDTPIAPQIVCH